MTDVVCRLGSVHSLLHIKKTAGFDEDILQWNSIVLTPSKKSKDVLAKVGYKSRIFKNLRNILQKDKPCRV